MPKPPGHGRGAHSTHHRHSRDAPRRINHRFLFLELRVACLSYVAQVQVGKHRALRLYAQRSVPRTYHAAHRRQRSRYQQRAAIYAQQQVTQRSLLPDPFELLSPLDSLLTI